MYKVVESSEIVAQFDAARSTRARLETSSIHHVSFVAHHGQPHVD